MADLVTLSSFFGSYTTILIVVMSLLLWVFFSKPPQTCPFGNHLPKSPPKIVSDSIASAKNDIFPTGSPKKRSKSKKCSNSCSKKAVEEKIISVYYSSQHETFAMAQKLQTLAQDFTCTLKSLEKPFNLEEALMQNKKGANVFILSSTDNLVHESLHWVKDWMGKRNGVKNLLSELKFSVFALDAEKVFDSWDRSLWRLGAQRLKKAKFADNEDEFEFWAEELLSVMTGKQDKKCCGTNGDKGGCSSGSSCSSDSEGDASPPPVLDVEDLLLPKKK